MGSNSLHRPSAHNGFSTSLLIALLSLLIELLPLQGLADDSVEGAPEAQKLPALKKYNLLYYPDRLKRVGLEGKVLAAFDITGSGRITNVAILYSDETAFEAIAKEYMSGLQFDVPSNWLNLEEHLIRYRLGFVFCIPPSSVTQTFGVPSFPVTVRTSRIPGSPIRNPVEPGMRDRCAS